MTNSTPKPVFGRILHSYPPFFVRQVVVEGITDLPHYVLSRPVITIPFRGEEFQITSTYDERTDLPWVLYALQLWLADSLRNIRSWEKHLALLQQPEELARVEADLVAGCVARQEQEAEGTCPSGGGADDVPHVPHPRKTAEWVLAKQRDELERIRQLNHDVEEGLQALEVAYPEAVAALDEVADEIQKSRAEIAERLRRGQKPPE